jgi:TM2 domain-containing membrane protein YozV
MESADDSKWDALSTLDLKNPQTALMLSIFGGPIGVDRLYIGDYLLGVFKTITCGGLLIWAFVDQFLIRRATKENNRQMFMEILTI